jgi:serine/threonine-protein kinase HipA
MGRKSHARALSVWVNGKLAGEWRIPARGETEFQYDSTWVESEEGRPLSLSLPFSLDRGSIKGRPVECYFDNLLPDADLIRKRVQDRFHTESRDAFDLLAAIGRDCVGAVQLLASDDQPKDDRCGAALGGRGRAGTDSDRSASVDRGTPCGR